MMLILSRSAVIAQAVDTLAAMIVLGEHRYRMFICTMQVLKHCCSCKLRNCFISISWLLWIVVYFIHLVWLHSGCHIHSEKHCHRIKSVPIMVLPSAYILLHIYKL